jgi:hypothetical protein
VVSQEDPQNDSSLAIPIVFLISRVTVMRQKEKSLVFFKFSSAFIFFTSLIAVNVLLVPVLQKLGFERGTAYFFINTTFSSLLFTIITLYKEKKEKFIMSRFLRFWSLTALSIAIVCFLFVVR